MSITKEKKSKLIKEFKINDEDTGSAEVQVAILSEKIINNLFKEKKILPPMATNI